MIFHQRRGGLAVRSRESETPSLGTLVWIHGLGESGLCFEGVLADQRLAGWTQRCLDLPGYGRSPWASRPLKLNELARLVASWIVSQTEGRVVVIGHSMGGVIGQMLCELGGEHRRRLAGFVNVEGNLTRGDCTASAWAAEQTQEEFVASGFARLQASTHRRGLEDSAQRGYAVSMALCDPRQFHLNSVELVDLSISEQLVPALASLQLPRLYICGAPGGAAQRSIELLREHQLPPVAIEPSGHWPFIDRPRQFVGELGTFLAAERT